MPNDRRLHEALLRGDFTYFLHKVFMSLNPGQQFIPSWHIQAIALQLERIRYGEITRLIINMPPRSLKSIMASVAFPAFLLGLDPTLRIISVSYSGDLAGKHANDTRAVMETAWYKSAFPNTRISRHKNTENEIELTRRGARFATSVGGTLTGRGGDIIVIDDPTKADDAFSDLKRNAANLWYNNTLLSRLDDKRTGAIVVVMQRVHMDDLTGFLLSQSDEWTVLNLAAIADRDEVIELFPSGTHRRKAGEALCSEREPLSILADIKRQIGSDAFSAQYQQAPIPPGGAMILRKWIRRYTDLPPIADRRIVTQSWDTASKGGPNNDWSVCTTWIRTRDNKRFLANVWRERVDYPRLKATVIRLAAFSKATRVLIEDTGAGTALIQELRGKVSGIVAVKPEGDKKARMAVVSAKFEGGEVYFPQNAPWLPDLESELFAFPVGKHDDQCDSISQALSDKNISWMSLLTREEWDVILAKSAIPDRRSNRLY